MRGSIVMERPSNRQCFRKCLERARLLSPCHCLGLVVVVKTHDRTTRLSLSVYCVRNSVKPTMYPGIEVTVRELTIELSTNIGTMNMVDES